MSFTGALTLETDIEFEFPSSNSWHKSGNDSYRGSCVFHQIFLENFSGLALYAANCMVMMTRFEIWVVFCKPTNLSEA